MSISRLIFAGNSCRSPAMTDKDAILAANAAYYAAFAEADFAAMSGLWAEDDVSCIHPGWPVLVGRNAILDSYKNILRNPNRERLEHRNHTVIMSETEGRVFCVELVEGAGFALAATNWFRHVDGAWRMVHHQASPIASMVDETAPKSSRRLN
jgi:ketosteroid isomerase-like protein